MNFFSTQYTTDAADKNSSLDNLAKLIHSWKNIFDEQAGRIINQNVDPSEEQLGPYTDEQGVSHWFMYRSTKDTHYTLDYYKGDDSKNYSLTVTAPDETELYNWNYFTNSLRMYNGLLEFRRTASDDYSYKIGQFEYTDSDVTYTGSNGSIKCVTSSDDIVDFSKCVSGIEVYGPGETLLFTYNFGSNSCDMYDTGIQINGSRLVVMSDSCYYISSSSSYANKYNKSSASLDKGNDDNVYTIKKDCPESYFISGELKSSYTTMFVYDIQEDIQKSSGTLVHKARLYTGFRNADGTVSSNTVSAADLGLYTEFTDNYKVSQYMFLDTTADVKVNID